MLCAQTGNPLSNVLVIFDPVMHPPVFEACVNDTMPESFVMQRKQFVCATSLSEVSSPLSEAISHIPVTVVSLASSFRREEEC